METHLRFEPDIRGDCHDYAFPVHVIFTHNTFSYDEFRFLHSVSFKVISRPNAQWKSVGFFEKIDREFLIKSILYERCKHLSADPGETPLTLYGGDERCTYGLVFSIVLDLKENDWYKDVIRFRLLVGDDKVVDMDCTVVKLIREGLRFYNEIKRLHPREPCRSRDGGQRRDKSSAEEDLDLPEGILSDESGFFDLGDRRKMSTEMEERLARFTVKRTSASDFGPLEPPSKVRGREIKNKRGEFFTDSDIVSEPVPVRSRTDKWFSGDNSIRVSRVQEVIGPRCFVVVWYSESYGLNVEIDTGRLDDSEAAVTSFQYTRLWEAAVTRVYNTAVREMVSIVSRIGSLSQRFYVNLCCDLRGKNLAELFWLSRDAWIVNATVDGCIIKAVSADLHQRRRNDDCNGWRVGWADVIWPARGRVASGIPVKLMRVGGDGLWRSYFDNGALTDWELNPEVCILYAFEDKTLLWALPGGFCVSFTLRADDADIKIIREKFEEH
uniref:DNA packaging tegument protein UL17 n=1 Tax=Mastomys natalensis cytomegalovirus 1 TaxID=2973541 RepID=A0A9Y1IQF2_9BETA|nr:DNA packaging tegument protein UL17 [Mastomys natalensis cytomegalovirus 1]WEG68951.1 DNA packaging tegument protein UL17 [Mastomys natalensis cytomegalovirus 1]WEG71179.1 DNA packaging tegument protein UL17 [Mastomys natalensis cytomegalovirus 1]